MKTTPANTPIAIWMPQMHTLSSCNNYKETRRGVIFFFVGKERVFVTVGFFFIRGAATVAAYLEVGQGHLIRGGLS